MSRILIWTGLYPPNIGGMEVLVQQLVRALVRRGHRMIVIAAIQFLDLPEISEDGDNGVPIYRFRFAEALETRDLAAILAIRRKIAALKCAFQPDVIHLHSGELGLFFHQQTQAVCPCPTLLTVHASAIFDRDPYSMIGRTLREAAWITAVSQAMLEDVLKVAPEVAARASVVLNGLEMPTIPMTAPNSDPPTLLCAGRVVEDKGFDVALDAFAQIHTRLPSARLVVAGDGPKLPALKAQAARLGISEAVSFLGWVDPALIPGLISQSSLVLMPSRWREPFGLVALQAAQMGRAIVAARVGGIPEIVVDGVTGLLVEPEDSAALAQAALTLLGDPDWAARMGRAAHARAEAHFSLERMVDEYERLYWQLTDTQA